jgi:hypothetical protein
VEKVKRIVEGIGIAILVIASVVISIIAIPIIECKMGAGTFCIATAVGGMSALIVQTACVILLYFNLKEQIRANDTLWKKHDDDAKLNKKQIEAIESRMNLQTYSRLKKGFGILFSLFEDMLKIPDILENYRAWRFYLCRLQQYLEDVKTENITQEKKWDLNKSVKDFIDNYFNEEVYNKIEEKLKKEHNLTQPYREIENLLMYRAVINRN